MQISQDRITRLFLRQITIGVFATLLVCQSGGVLRAQEKTDQPVCEGDLAEQIKSRVDAAAKDAGFSGAVLVAKDGEVILAHAAGQQDNSAKDELQTTTLFEIASCTKSFTGVAAVLLQQQGRLNLDDSIAEHLPGVPDHCKSITVRHLLQHTSGIPGDTYGPRTSDASAAVAAFLRNAPKSRPGTKHEYWNQGYALLSEVIASASGKSFADFCKEEIFAPVKMTSSRFNGDEAPADRQVAVGKSLQGPKRSALSHPYSDSYDFSYRAMGGMVTNVWDINRFFNVLDGESLLTKESIVEMTTIGKSDYALGWKIQGKDDDLAWWHSGGVRGFVSVMKYFPNTKSHYIILTNSDDGRAVWPLAQYFDQALKGQLLGPIDGEMLAKISGTYVAGRRSFTIPDTAETLTGEFHWGGPVTRGPLGMMGDGKVGFFDGDKNYPVEFEFGEDGKATGCTVFDTELTRRK